MEANAVENFVRFLISLGGIYETDEAGYVVRPDTKEKRQISINGRNKSIMVFKEMIEDSDAIILNPLNETLSETEDKVFLYDTMALGLSRRLKTIVDNIAMKCTSDTELSILEMELISVFSTDIDDKFKEEFELLTKNLSIFCNTYYRKKFKEARWRCSVFETDVRDSLKIRKKTWKAIDLIFQTIFDLSSMNVDEVIKKYSFSTSIISCPKLMSMLNLYSMIYSKLNKYSEILGGPEETFVVDLDELGHHIANLEEYYNRVKWHTSSETAEVKPTAAVVEEFSPLFKPNAMVPTGRPTVGGFAETPEGVPIVTRNPPPGFGGSVFPGSGAGMNLFQDNQRYIDPFGSVGMNMNNNPNQWGTVSLQPTNIFGGFQPRRMFQ